MKYGYTKEVAVDFALAIARVKEELMKEGFGTLFELNIADTLKKKLDVELGQYVILGACNPPFAYKALQAEPEIGLLLPCNVIVYEKGGVVSISAIVPSVAMGVVENNALADIALEVEMKLKRAVDAV